MFREEPSVSGDEERMDVEAQIEALNKALRLQQRSLLQYLITAGSIVGLEFQAHAEKLKRFAAAEAEDTIRLVEKVTSLGGDPVTDAPEAVWVANPAEALEQLIDAETETLETLQAAIESTGHEAASEAMEHRLEHIIMRKQEQVDYLLRANRRP